MTQVDQVDTAPRPRRGVELMLLLLGLVIAVGAKFLVAVTMEEPITPSYYVTTGVFAAVALAFHVVLRLRAKYADPFVLPIVVTLNGLGIAMIHRLDLSSGAAPVEPRQLLWTVVSAVAAMALLWLLRDHRRLRQLTYISLVLSLILLVLPLIPGLGMSVNGARIWVNLGFASFQPAEIGKITLAVFFAGFLANSRDLILLAGRKIGPMQLPRVRDLGPLFIAWILAIGVLVVQNDLGNSIMFFGLFMATLYVATSRLSWILIGLTLVAVGGVLAFLTVPHVGQRVDVWLHAFDPEIYGREFGGSLQIVQGLFGLANGGLAGTGFGGGMPNRVPLANSDMIFASFGEELGMVGLGAILMLYLLLFSRFMRAGLGTRDAFGKLLAVGFAMVLVLQVFVVLGGITRVIPMTGLATPFLAAGGSALLANWLIVALVLLVSHAARRPIVVGPMVNATGESAAGTESPARQAPAHAAARPTAPTAPEAGATGSATTRETPTDDAAGGAR